MDRAQKREEVAELGTIFSESGAVVVTRYAGLNVAQMTDLRRRMRDVGAEFKVTKNRLAKIALDNTERGQAGDMFTGPTGIAYGVDPVAPAKVVSEFAKDHDRLIIIGGLVGQSVVDEKAIEALAKMPSMDEMRARLLGTLSAPGTNLARVLNAPGNKFVRQLNAPASNLVGVLHAYRAKQEAA